MEAVPRVTGVVAPLPQQLCRCDIIEDVRLINDLAMKAAPHKTGMLILGGGVPKHHICNANLMRNGADFAVYINTGQVRLPVRLNACCMQPPPHCAQRCKPCTI